MGYGWGATTGLMAIMATMERDLQMPSQSLLLLLSPRLMLMPGTATTATAATDGVATTGLTTTATMERGPQMLSQSLLLLLTLTLMLMPGTVTTAMATAATDGAVTTGLMATMATGAKQANREVDSSSDCDFPPTLASISRACA